MDKTSDLFENYSEYFELFQKQTEYSNRILENAKSIKKSIQDIYKNITINKQNINSDIWVFDFDVILTQVSEQPEPNYLKLFTRQFTPVITMYRINNNIEHVCKIKLDDDTRFIHKHINELYVGESISQEFFFDVAQQYFLLDFVYGKLSQGGFKDSFVSKVKESCSEYNQTSKNIICINCKIRGRKAPLGVNPNLRSAINHINTLWNTLVSQSLFIIIGNYKNYLNENELIYQLNDSNSRHISEDIFNYFQNDFLLLNNMEFMNNEKPSTIEWSDIIIAPKLLEKRSNEYFIKDIEEIKKSKEQIFLYQKIKPDGIFYKTEIYIPDKDLSSDNFNKIVTLSMELLKLKQSEER